MNPVSIWIQARLNDTCGRAGGVYRVDRSDDLDWLARFGLAPAS